MTTRVMMVPAALVALATLLSGCGATTKTVMIKSVPEGASVSIDGKDVGTTPVKSYEVEFKKSDSLELLVQKDYYLPFSTSIKNDGKKTEDFELLLVKVADVALDASVEAQIYQGAELLGPTPLTHRLVFNDSDSITLTFKAEGYKDLEKSFAIDGPNSSNFTADLEPVSHTETVFFDTDPQGATITMGYEYLCDTPCEVELNDLNPKYKPQLKIERRGFSSKLVNLEYKGMGWKDRNWPKRMKLLLTPAAGNEAYDAKALGIAPTEKAAAAPIVVAPMMGGSQPAQQPVYYNQQPAYQQPQPVYQQPQQPVYQQPVQQQYVAPQAPVQQPAQQPVQQPVPQPAQTQPATGQ